MWDMRAGVQKASFTADKVRKPPFYFNKRPRLLLNVLVTRKQQLRLFFHEVKTREREPSQVQLIVKALCLLRKKCYSGVTRPVQLLRRDA